MIPGRVGDVHQRAVNRVGSLPPVVHRVVGGIGRRLDLTGGLDRAGGGPVVGVPRRVARVKDLRAAGLGRAGTVDEETEA